MSQQEQPEAGKARRRRGAGDGAGSEDDPAPSTAGGDPDATARGDTDATGGRRTPLTQQIGRIVVVLLLVLFGVFAAANAHPVDFSWVFGATEITEDATGAREGGVPLIVLLLASFVVGAVVGGVTAWQGARTRRRAEAAGSGAATRRSR